MHATDLSHNELAKSHARYLVGGRSSVPNERLFRFEFPERPGALKRFLGELQAGFNISLFHYRNIGSDNGRVLVGIQVPSDAESKLQFDQFLQRLGYPYVEETDNAVFDQFLRS
ncbi:threonine dehydratase [Ramicandelaber brevisporus]|nr:threonine dehydratase [Ramicandelaber brevisporus]